MFNLDLTIGLLPIIIRQIVITMVFLLMITRIATGSWRLAINRSIIRLMFFWIAFFVGSLLIPTIFMKLGELLISFEALIFIGMIFKKDIDKLARYLSSRPDRNEWGEVIAFWKRIINYKSYSIMLMIVLVTDFNLVSIIMSLIILIGISYYISHFLPGTLSKIRLDSDKTRTFFVVGTLVIVAIRILRAMALAWGIIESLMIIAAIVISYFICQDDLKNFLDKKNSGK